MGQGFKALRVPYKPAILCHLNNMGLAVILSDKATTGLKGGAHNIAQAGTGKAQAQLFGKAAIKTRLLFPG
jgi:hypothetical protein